MKEHAKNFGGGGEDALRRKPITSREMTDTPPSYYFNHGND